MVIVLSVAIEIFSVPDPQFVTVFEVFGITQISENCSSGDEKVYAGSLYQTDIDLS